MSDKYQQLNKGTEFRPSRGLRADEVRLDEIAHALANVCRFGGHCREFYSVAQHSVLCYDIMRDLTDDPTMHLVALLHDASEAYVGDMPKPLKDCFPEFEAFEFNIQHAIADHFGFDVSLVGSKLMKLVDEMALKTESDVLIDKTGRVWVCDSTPFPRTKSHVFCPVDLAAKTLIASVLLTQAAIEETRA